MYHRMLVPLDGSELAEVVFTYAKEIAGRLDIDVTLLHVAPSSGKSMNPMQQAYITQAAETVKKSAREVQQEAGISQASEAIKVQGELVGGYPPEEILKYAEEHDIDLILMAARGHSGLKRWSIGSVASKVLSASKIPVWLVRADHTPDEPFDTWPSLSLIVPLDGSELAESVIPHAESLSKQRGAKDLEVILVRIAETPTIPSYYGPELSGVTLNWGEFMQQEEARRKKTAAEYLETIAARFTEKNIKVRTEVIEGKATDELINFANNNPYSMIIIASHGRSGFSKLVYGSVAATLLNNVTCPILMIKPKHKE
ncbi:MAG: universal stress protein [Dehalococcoidales bacterium]|jgi:nucleotide-binding universal stress UspA family protein|nr:universal stress protein [Dehalococcoidales bacterium]